MKPNLRKDTKETVQRIMFGYGCKKERLKGCRKVIFKELFFPLKKKLESMNNNQNILNELSFGNRDIYGNVLLFMEMVNTLKKKNEL